MNLTKTQQDVVLRMADGAKLYLLQVSSRFVLTDKAYATVRHATVWALENKGAIKRTADGWRSTRYTLTDAGREEASRIKETHNANAQD